MKEQDIKLAIEQECDAVGIPITSVKHYWYKGEHFSINALNPYDRTTNFLNAIEDICKNFVGDSIRKPKVIRKVDTPVAIKVTLSDMHVGLEPNPHDSGMFEYSYNKEIFYHNIDYVYSRILDHFNSNGTFDLLIIDDLGDGLDGYEGKTTRGGHGLEQNMSSKEAFETFVGAKLSLIERCIDEGIAAKYLIRNVCNDNHAGSFASISNMAIKMLLDRIYEESVVDFYILEKFMSHFTYGDHAFIITHGKDSKYMFKGLPYQLNDKTVAFINEYIDHFGIDNKFIHLEKGDLHRIGYDRTKKFDYRNFMSFAPPSAWVQHNFGDGYCGFSIQIVPKFGGEISHTDYYFDLTKKK